MENTIGLGGITLVVAAIVWLVIFVPGFTKRSEIRATTSIVKTDAKQAKKATAISQDERLSRLIRTQRGFSVLFGLSTLGMIASAIATTVDSIWWTGVVLLGISASLCMLIQRAAGVHAARIATIRHSNNQAVRSQASKKRPEAVSSREWTPNPLPAPLNQPKIGEIAAPLAEIIEIDRPRPTLKGSEIDAIMARRRAI